MVHLDHLPAGGAGCMGLLGCLPGSGEAGLSEYLKKGQNKYWNIFINLKNPQKNMQIYSKG